MMTMTVKSFLAYNISIYQWSYLFVEMFSQERPMTNDNSIDGIDLNGQTDRLTDRHIFIDR
jgi:hypothetical protein